MKKVFLTAMVAVAFAFCMTACNNNKEAEATEDTVAVEAVEACEHACECTDSICTHDCATCPKAGTEECCKVKAAEECCNHEGCNHEGCNHECEHNCEHAN